MLHNPKHDHPTLTGFIAWLEQQNPDDTYNYTDPNSCAIARYCESIGKTYWDARMHDDDMVFEWNVRIAAPGKHTFGAALKRARELRGTRDE